MTEPRREHGNAEQLKGRSHYFSPGVSPTGHFYEATYIRMPGVFCPHCGAQDVWEAQDGGDYYHGPSQPCRSCGAIHCCLSAPEAVETPPNPYPRAAVLVWEDRTEAAPEWTKESVDARRR